jgi:signal transduction histidine kinase
VFGSLRWRIASGYALLLAVVVAAIGVLIVWRFQAILYDNAAQRVNRTMGEIVADARPNELFDLSGETPLETLINSGNIERWDSPTTYVQISTPGGAVLNKSSNLGSESFPRNPNVSFLHPGPQYRTVQLESGPFLVEDEYLQLDPQTAVTAQVAEPLDVLQRTLAQTRYSIATIILAALAAVVVLSILLARQVTEPVNELARTMREIETDHLERRVRLRSRRDEIGQLAESFNDLLARLGEAFARERQFISDASHELKTPLTSIKANAQMLLRWGNRDETVLRDSLETIANESGLLANMVNGMLTLAKADRGDDIPKTAVSLAAIAIQSVRLAQQRATEKGLALSTSGTGEAMVLGDEVLLRQLVGNLIDNAIKFTERGEVVATVGSNADESWIEIRDTGSGVPEDEIPMIFERFYRADKARSRTVQGTGLGLAIVRSIARVHDGVVTAARLPGGGTLFRAAFPRLRGPFT